MLCCEAVRCRALCRDAREHAQASVQSRQSPDFRATRSAGAAKGTVGDDDRQDLLAGGADIQAPRSVFCDLANSCHAANNLHSKGQHCKLGSDNDVLTRRCVTPDAGRVAGEWASGEGGH